MSETEVAEVPVMEQTPNPPEEQPAPKRKRKLKAASEADGATIDADARNAAGGIEAMLVTMDRPVPAGQLAEALPISDPDRAAAVVHRAVEIINDQLDETKRAFRIEKVAGGYRLMTRPEHAWAISALHGVRESHKLTRAAVETLAIVAYRQPITRAEIEAIRGVAAGDILRALLDRRLVAIVGRAEELGRPMLYGTSKRFLELFGLSSLKDLPSVGELFPGVDIKPQKKRTMTSAETGVESAEAAPAEGAKEAPTETPES
jgi:segregation and condensation protein B